ncbi:MAG: hypothetical protein HYV97_00645 [Bdellovibrio sp.]|nr:hypothetical protein [Bdellovibrio sp.]
MTNYAHYVHLLTYPSPSWYESVSKIPETEYLDKFRRAIQGKEVSELEELFTSTFDIQGVCCLDVGHVLFGDDYKRAEFLVGVSQLERESGIDAGTELPDHLPNILKLLSVMPNSEIKKEMLESAVKPAVQKMLESFPASNERCNPYKFVFQGLMAQLETEGVVYA